MRIGIIGAHGTGKTTLAEKLAAEYNLPLIKEQARIVAKELGLDTLYNLTLEQRIKLQRGILEKQMAEEKKYYDQGFVSDRTVIDNLAYWYYYNLHNLATFEFGTALYKVREYLKELPYDLIVYVIPEWDVQDDGFRFTCKGCQYTTDGLINNLLFMFGEDIPALFDRVKEIKGSTEERLEQVKKIIKEGNG